jgi:N-acetyl-beta-hexosaminidase
MKHLFFTITFFFSLPMFIHGQYNVVPGFQEVQSEKGKFRLTADSRIVADTGTFKKLERDLVVFKNELGMLTGLEPALVEGNFQKGDLVFTLDASDESLGDEGYQMKIARQVIINANTTRGAFYGMQSLLQLFSQDNNIQKGTIRDYPRFSERGFMIDIGRKYFEIAYIESLIRKLAWMKMNFIHLHFTDWNGFRLQTDLYPGLAAEQSYSKEDIRRIQDYAEKYHIMVVPEIDLPAHATVITEYNPYLAFKCPSMRSSWWQTYSLEKSGYPLEDQAWTLDITRREVRSWIKALLDEWIPLFDGPYFHIGGDEYQYDREKYACEELVMAAEEMGYEYPGDVFVDYINDINEHVKSYGKTTQIWNWWRFSQNEERQNHTSIQPAKDIVINVWNRPRLEDIVDEGYRVVITSEEGEEALYVVPDYGHNPGEYGYFDSKKIYEQWKPQTDPNINGFKICLWTNELEDKPDEWFNQFIHLPIAVLAERTWSIKQDNSIEQFQKRLNSVMFQIITK